MDNTSAKATKPLTLLTFLAVILAFVVVVLGAYTRLRDSGLGCPDWPGCYHHIGGTNDTKCDSTR